VTAITECELTRPVRRYRVRAERRLFSLTRLACQMVETRADSPLRHRSPPTLRPADMSLVCRQLPAAGANLTAHLPRWSCERTVQRRSPMSGRWSRPRCSRVCAYECRRDFWPSPSLSLLLLSMADADGSAIINSTAVHRCSYS